MRTLLFALCVVVLLGVASPAQAQLRQDLPAERPSVRLFGGDGPVASLNQLFSPQVFQMSHSYEFSSFSGGGGGSFGMYTNSMQWQFNQKLAARVDVGFLHSPFGGNAMGALEEGQPGRVLLRNAEIAYRPTENMRLHLQVGQSPYGRYASPYGTYRGGYGMSSFGLHTEAGDPLFWRDATP